MGKNFEDDFMDLQADLISLCLEAAGQKVDKVYVYCSIEKKSKMFNAFFVVNNKIKMLNQLDINKALIMQFLKSGTDDLEKVRNVCVNYNMPVPTEMKMYYDVKTGKYDAQYKYEEVCSEKTGKNAGEIFLSWVSELEEMDIVDALLKYMEVKDKRILIKNVQISDYGLTVVAVKILSWLKLEHKRSIWISQGKRTCFKSLEVDRRYPWCANLYKLVENEKLFQDYFLIMDSKLDFADLVSEEDRRKAREKAYQNYNPQKHT